VTGAEQTEHVLGHGVRPFQERPGVRTPRSLVSGGIPHCSQEPINYERGYLEDTRLFLLYNDHVQEHSIVVNRDVEPQAIIGKPESATLFCCL
jgi:hypothetical protein